MLFDDTYRSIDKPSEGLYKEKGSRFLGFAFPVQSEDEIKSILNRIKKEHFQASHHCYAFRLGPDKTHFRFSDDREPSGTAGKPILNQIFATDLSDVLVVVARYFGGSLLGVPGLIHAYKSAAKDTLDHAIIKETVVQEKYRVSFTFDVMNEVMGLLKTYQAIVIDQTFLEDCSIDYSIRRNKADELNRKIKAIYKTEKPPVVKLLA